VHTNVLAAVLSIRKIAGALIIMLVSIYAHDSAQKFFQTIALLH